MAVVIVLLMAGFGIAGVVLLLIFLRELGRKIVRLPYLKRVEGAVTAVMAKESQIQSDSSGPTIAHFPVIRFEAQGRSQTFTSAFGSGNRTRYVVGQKIGVRYDPTGQIPPAIDSWAGMWLSPVIGIAGGVVFLGGAVLVYVAFGRRALGW